MIFFAVLPFEIDLFFHEKSQSSTFSVKSSIASGLRHRLIFLKILDLILTVSCLHQKSGCEINKNDRDPRSGIRDPVPF